MDAVNQAQPLPELPSIRVMTKNTVDVYPNENVKCDVWHLAGQSDPFDYSRPDYALLKKLKERLPRVDFEVKIGSTGYIIWGEDVPENGWTLDDMGRTIGVVKNIRFFQRHTNNCMLVCNINKNYFTTLIDDEREAITHLLD